jgi:hypothetical protein
VCIRTVMPAVQKTASYIRQIIRDRIIVYPDLRHLQHPLAGVIIAN